MSARTSVRGAVPLIVSAGIIISLCMGIRQSLGLFLQPISADLGVSATAFGFALAMQNLVWGLTQPFVGAAGDRYGARPVLIGAAGVYVAGLLLMALVVPVAVAVTRVVLGVHYVSDVTAGLLIGWGWTAACTAFFTAWRAQEGRPVAPLEEGVGPSGAYVASLGAERRDALRAELFRRLEVVDAPFMLDARAFLATGRTAG